MYAVGGRRGLIMVLEGREGLGWSRFATEMSKVKVYFESMGGSSAVMLGLSVSPFPSSKDGSVPGVKNSKGGETPSYAKVVRLAGSSSVKKIGSLDQSVVA